MIAAFLGGWVLTLINAATKGIGKQSLAGKNNILAYYIIDIPLGIYFTFYCSKHFSREYDTHHKVIAGLGHKGLFIGKIIG